MHAYKFQLRAVDLAASCLFCHSIAYTFLVSFGSVHTRLHMYIPHDFIKHSAFLRCCTHSQVRRSSVLLLYVYPYQIAMKSKLSTRRQTEVNAHMHPHTNKRTLFIPKNHGDARQFNVPFGNVAYM